MKLGLLAAAVLAAPLPAHEFWLSPEKFSAAPGEAVGVRLQVGVDFSGETQPWTVRRVAALRHGTAAGLTDARALVPAALQLPVLAFPLATPGAHLLACDTNPSRLELSADKFTDYLRDEGLDAIAHLRADTHREAEPSRERYQRCLKTLLLVGEKSDATYATRTGQRLEIVPLSDPLVAHPGARLGFAVFFDGRPLPGALVKAWHRRDAQLHLIKSRTAADGSVRFDLSFAGPWMISVVHMLPLAGDPEIDWHSYWGNLTFALRE